MENIESTKKISVGSEREVAEYVEAIGLYKFFHGYRAQNFNVFVTLSGALLVVTLEHAGGAESRLVLSAFGVAFSVLSLMLEIRNISLAREISSRILEIEGVLDFGTLRRMRSFSSRHVLSQRFLYRSFYIVAALLWLCVPIFGVGANA